MAIIATSKRSPRGITGKLVMYAGAFFACLITLSALMDGWTVFVGVMSGFAIKWLLDQLQVRWSDAKKLSAKEAALELPTKPGPVVRTTSGSSMSTKSPSSAVPSPQATPATSTVATLKKVKNKKGRTQVVAASAEIEVSLQNVQPTSEAEPSQAPSACSEACEDVIDESLSKLQPKLEVSSPGVVSEQASVISSIQEQVHDEFIHNDEMRHDASEEPVLSLKEKELVVSKVDEEIHIHEAQSEVDVAEAEPAAEPEPPAQPEDEQQPPVEEAANDESRELWQPSAAVMEALASPSVEKAKFSDTQCLLQREVLKLDKKMREVTKLQQRLADGQVLERNQHQKIARVDDIRQWSEKLRDRLRAMDAQEAAEVAAAEAKAAAEAAAKAAKEASRKAAALAKVAQPPAVPAKKAQTKAAAPPKSPVMQPAAELSPVPSPCPKSLLASLMDDAPPQLEGPKFAFGVPPPPPPGLSSPPGLSQLLVAPPAVEPVGLPPLPSFAGGLAEAEPLRVSTKMRLDADVTSGQALEPAFVQLNAGPAAAAAASAATPLRLASNGDVVTKSSHDDDSTVVENAAPEALPFDKGLAELEAAEFAYFRFAAARHAAFAEAEAMMHMQAMQAHALAASAYSGEALEADPSAACQGAEYEWWTDPMVCAAMAQQQAEQQAAAAAALAAGFGDWQWTAGHTEGTFAAHTKQRWRKVAAKHQ